MNVSEYIFDFFANKGVDTAFMVTGGQAMWLNDAVGKNKSYQIVCTHHEQTAAMSADAYGRFKNKPALTVVTAGPGAVNAINGVVSGYTDSSPMIVISGQAELSFVEYQQKTGIRQHGVMGINIKLLVESTVKHFARIDDLTKVKYDLEQAFYLATTGRPGPVWIEVPLDIQSKQIDESVFIDFVPEKIKDQGVSVNQAVKHAAELLAKAERPVLLVGQGVSLAGARDSFRNLIEEIKVPVITARLGIDLIESDNELYVGRPGSYGERSAHFALQSADLILSVGCRLSSSLVGQSPEEFGKNAYLYVVDIDPKELNKPGPLVDYKVCADAKVFMDKLLARVSEEKLPSYDVWIRKCNFWKENYPVVRPEYKAEKPVNSYYFIDRLSKLTDEYATIMVDGGSCFHVACQTWKVKKGQNYLTTGGTPSLGFWVAGIGACLANDKKDTVIITGDGSLQMNIQEFATIRHNNLPIKTFILNNNGYLLIRHAQRNFMEDRFVGESPDSGVWCPDSMKIARAYGIKGVRIESVDELDEKINEVLSFEGPVICEVMTPEWQLLAPSIALDKLPDGTLKPRRYEDMFPYLPEGEVEKNMEGACRNEALFNLQDSC